MAYNKEKAAENRKKREEEVEKELGGTAVMEQPKAANEFDDEYTLQVDADYDPSADIFRVPTKDPNFEYRWVRDESKRLSRVTSSLLHQLGGWELVKKQHALRLGFKESEISEDGHKRIGEHVLAFMPKSLYEKKLAGKKEKVNARTSGIRRHVEDGIQVVGGRNAQSRKRDKSQKDNLYETPND